MRLRNFFLLGLFYCFSLFCTGCLSLGRYGESEDTPNILAEKLKMRKNYWYVLENNGDPALFYNDFQDYVLIVKAKDNLDTNIMFRRDSLSQAFRECSRNIKLPPECKDICVHFLYEGRKALFFDLDTFRNKYGNKFFEFIVNDGKNGIGYSSLFNYICTFSLLYDVSDYRIIQSEPDFHLLGLSSVKSKNIFIRN